MLYSLEKHQWVATQAEKKKVQEIFGKMQATVDALLCLAAPNLSVATDDYTTASVQVNVVTPTENQHHLDYETVLNQAPVDDEQVVSVSDKDDEENDDDAESTLDNNLKHTQYKGIGSVEGLLAAATLLDFQSEEHLSPNGGSIIKLSSCKHYTETMRTHAVYLFLLLRDQMEEKNIAKGSVCRAILDIIAYDFGYTKSSFIAYIFGLDKGL